MSLKLHLPPPMKTAQMESKLKGCSGHWPVFLNKDCNLIEYLEFTKAFVLYMQSSGICVPDDCMYNTNAFVNSRYSMRLQSLFKKTGQWPEHPLSFDSIWAVFIGGGRCSFSDI